ncbi:Hypothetical protein CINCED_3A018860 [Cinara cedri]|uniref:Uncharacterized protein n=1 Tax=Cinara cedri TaxID=506608 RepID=A0A5E4NER9_9HEMI|nr:Hypothetical protein CINCED_3A018860 [Cinara cedri]
MIHRNVSLLGLKLAANAFKALVNPHRNMEVVKDKIVHDLPMMVFTMSFLEFSLELWMMMVNRSCDERY